MGFVVVFGTSLLYLDGLQILYSFGTDCKSAPAGGLFGFDNK
jgi:hypothetical protein